VVARPCEGSWELVESLDSVCVAPLWLGGLRGKKSTPSIGWEVPVKSCGRQVGVARSTQDIHSEQAMIHFLRFVW
jgi:hypothetical protein